LAYSSLDDLEKAAGGHERLIQLADWNGDGSIDLDVIAAAQAKADALIDSFAAIRYAVPVRDPSPALVQISADEVVFQLKLRRQMVAEADVTERDFRFQWLEKLSMGKTRPSDPPPPKSSAVKSRATESMRAVSREKLAGYW